MLSFVSDYSQGCHPRILEALSRTNLDQEPGYGLDDHCAAAARAIREAIACPGADVHFIPGGTPANMIATAAFLRPHQGVISAVSGHINGHETGAPEATGHKILAVPGVQGKLTAALIQGEMDLHTDEHTVQPAMVYISQSTEVGTVYSRTELEEIHACCQKNGLYLYLDGARIACGLAASDVTLADLPRLCDAFYLGGTKNGALLGEAMVIVNDALKPGFRYLLKQRGGMLAKGWVLGIQFEELFRDGLYLELGRRASEMGQRLARGLEERGYELLFPSPTNQIFPVLDREQYRKLSGLCLFHDWEKLPDGRQAVRLVTSWTTTPEMVDALLAQL